MSKISLRNSLEEVPLSLLLFTFHRCLRASSSYPGLHPPQNSRTNLCFLQVHLYLSLQPSWSLGRKIYCKAGILTISYQIWKASFPLWWTSPAPYCTHLCLWLCLWFPPFTHRQRTGFCEGSRPTAGQMCAFTAWVSASCYHCDLCSGTQSRWEGTCLKCPELQQCLDEAALCCCLWCHKLPSFPFSVDSLLRKLQVRADI